MYVVNMGESTWGMGMHLPSKALSTFIEMVTSSSGPCMCEFWQEGDERVARRWSTHPF